MHHPCREGHNNAVLVLRLELIMDSISFIFLKSDGQKRVPENAVCFGNS